ncbi:MAG: hypothetical protein FJ308_21415, partial [Planctomycetes bacterium]|nr:hypothetical protein [Planctomycetota bacterium]
MKLFYHLRTKLRSRRAQSTRQATALAILFNAILLGSSSPTTRAEDGGPKPETKKMTIQPMAESKPSLAIRFIPDPSEDLDGNAAIFYLKAMGFLEQGPARDRLREIQRKAAEQAKAMGRDLGDVPPISYTTTAPKDYPKQEVRDYLDSSLAFQVPILREAQRYRNFSMDRNIRLSDNPIGYLLPEIQAIRDLARTQSIRCRLAIAENRTEDAIQIVGQQLAMSRHLGMDDFLVSSLVGNAVLAMATDDTLYLLEIANCPNLYWAFTQLPNPLLDIEKCISYERQFAYLQIPRLREVDTEPKQETYWNDFLVDFSERTLDLDQ